MKPVTPTQTWLSGKTGPFLALWKRVFFSLGHLQNGFVHGTLHSARLRLPLLSIRADSVARDDGGAPGQVYLPAWRRTYDRLVKMLRQAYAQVEELTVEREHLITELQFLQSGRLEREEITQTLLQQICKDEKLRKRVCEAETAVRLGGKELQIHCYRKLAELSEDDLEVFKSCISNLIAENTELKEKLKKFESQVEIES